jgi:hypothetical protein
MPFWTKNSLSVYGVVLQTVFHPGSESSSNVASLVADDHPAVNSYAQQSRVGSLFSKQTKEKCGCWELCASKVFHHALLQYHADVDPSAHMSSDDTPSATNGGWMQLMLIGAVAMVAVLAVMVCVNIVVPICLSQPVPHLSTHAPTRPRTFNNPP